METKRIMYDDDQLNVIAKVNTLLAKHGLVIEFVSPDEPKDGYEEIYVEEIKK